MTVYLPNIDDTAHAIGADKKKADALDDWFGEVKSTSPFRVAPLGSNVGLECTPIGSADVGDIVYVTTRKNGHFVAHCGVSGGGGGGGGSDKYYVHEQDTDAFIWNIQHYMGKNPSVTVVESGGNVVEGYIIYIDPDNVQVQFNAETRGVAYCN